MPDASPPDHNATVLTPAGRVRAEKVEHLRPGQAVRRNDDGTYSVIDNTGSQHPDPKERNPDDRPRPDPRRL